MAEQDVNAGLLWCHPRPSHHGVTCKKPQVSSLPYMKYFLNWKGKPERCIEKKSGVCTSWGEYVRSKEVCV